MTVQEFIDTRVRPSIGDTLHPQDLNPQPNTPTKQMTKYSSDVLLDFLNEGVLDISENSSLFVKKGYSILKEGDTEVKLPKDFKGFYKSSDASVGNATNFGAKMEDIHLIPHLHGVRLKEPLTGRVIGQYKERTKGMVLDTPVIEALVEAGLIPPEAQVFTIDSLIGGVLLEYEYRALPVEYTLDATLEGRELMYLLKWWTCSSALYADMHNESSNLATIYSQKYSRRLEKSGQMIHNWNEISLSPYAPKGGY